MEDAPNVCSLDRKDREERLDALARFASQALVEGTPTERGVLLRLKNSRATQTRLWSLIEAEKRCCPFLEFGVRIADDAVWLEVSGPPDVRPDLRGVFGLKAAIA